MLCSRLQKLAEGQRALTELPAPCEALYAMPVQG